MISLTTEAVSKTKVSNSALSFPALFRRVTTSRTAPFASVFVVMHLALGYWVKTFSATDNNLASVAHPSFQWTCTG